MKKIFNPEPIDIKNNPDITEKIIQDIIAENPSIIGLGDLILKDKERILPKSGRLDLLMQDPESSRRYEIELQLGKTDESHIIRTIEYWDIERKRYPQYDHCAVIIAEEITSRFLNVISLFNGSIPLIAIQMKAYKFDDQVGLIFNTVLDESRLGLVDDDEEVQEITNRDFWLKRGTEDTLKMADEILEIVNSITPGYALKYNKFYIGLAKDDQPDNFAICRPKKNYMRIELRIPKSTEMDNIIEKSALEEMDYDSRWGRYRIRLNKGDIKKHHDVIKNFLTLAKNG
ncbi:MAG: hypothetical protein IM606_08260 [Cytophagales bacterium]|jgi:hypothetical protein|nr:hypothetical protein [Cytophagales bacterium]MCA6389167.1 hypothetical protein [Cytophagales bacterium]MCA6392886.1 hypothetical protein [Cytophagales bacterium]MCA6395168.1 hypothetical protein [Cytophagales bacterium]MCA6398706.1 hypothetical protein [Cytophagales bacterium]